MKSSVLLLALMASACIVQTRAGKFDSFFDKVLGEGHKAKEEKEEDLYEGGLVKQIAHAAVDAGGNRAEEELKKLSDNKLLDMGIDVATDQIEKSIHRTISDMGKDEEDEKPKEGEQPKPDEGEQPVESEKKEEGGLNGLINKLTRRKRGGDPNKTGFFSRFMNRVLGQSKTPPPGPAEAKPSAQASAPVAEVKKQEASKEEVPAEQKNEETKTDNSAEEEAEKADEAEITKEEVEEAAEKKEAATKENGE